VKNAREMALLPFTSR